MLGTPVEAIMATEDRDVFNQKLAGEMIKNDQTRGREGKGGGGLLVVKS